MVAFINDDRIWWLKSLSVDLVDEQKGEERERRGKAIASKAFKWTFLGREVTTTDFELAFGNFNPVDFRQTIMEGGID